MSRDGKMDAHLHAASCEDAVFLMESGLSFSQAAHRLGLSEAALEKRMERFRGRYGDPRKQAGAGEAPGGGAVLPLRDSDEGG